MYLHLGTGINQGNQTVLLHDEQFVLLSVLPIKDFKRFARIFDGYVLTKLSPFIKGVICDLKRVLFIGLDFSYTVCAVVVN